MSYWWGVFCCRAYALYRGGVQGGEAELKMLLGLKKPHAKQQFFDVEAAKCKRM